MSTPRPAGGGDQPPRGSMRSQLELLIGNKRRLIVSLSVLSILSGVTEAATLAIVAQVAATLVKGKGVHGKTGLFDVHASVGTLLWIGLALTLLRLFLQWPLSMLPARIAADVQMRLRTRVFRAFTRASWEVQSRDREGQLQEIDDEPDKPGHRRRAAGDERC